MSDCCCENPDVRYPNVGLEEVRLYGRRAKITRDADADADKLDGDDVLRVTLEKGAELTLAIKKKSASTKPSIGIIYGYSFEGHCYKLPKPAIMLIPAVPKDVEAGDCGYTKDLGYSVWVVDKLERVVTIDIRADTVKALVLDENTPGNRSPLAYSQNQALAPQRNNRDY